MRQTGKVVQYVERWPMQGQVVREINRGDQKRQINAVTIGPGRQVWGGDC